VAEPKLWAWVREQLITRPKYVAKMTDLPELAGFRNMTVPDASIKLTDLIAIYEKQNPSNINSKRRAMAIMNRLIAFTGAKTLADLTTEELSAWRQDIETNVEGGGTKKNYYGKIKTIISFGLKVGMDQAQIRAALDRCAVLWTDTPLPSVQPKPISREHFHALLKKAGKAPWRAWLLVSLNLCMSIEEVCGLLWKDFDLTKKTYAAIRAKTLQKRIPRAAVLWPETIQALKGLLKLPNKGPYVFTSIRGTRYNKNTKLNDFAELREAAGLPDGVTFGTLRDGAYTAASHGTSDGRLARVLAGHRSPGLEDNYVLRNPEIVRPACEVVYKAYGPFPVAK
jgi:integrase